MQALQPGTLFTIPGSSSIGEFGPQRRIDSELSYWPYVPWSRVSSVTDTPLQMIPQWDHFILKQLRTDGPPQIIQTLGAGTEVAPPFEVWMLCSPQDFRIYLAKVIRIIYKHLSAFTKN